MPNIPSAVKAGAAVFGVLCIGVVVQSNMGPKPLEARIDLSGAEATSSGTRAPTEHRTPSIARTAATPSDAQGSASALSENCAIRMTATPSASALINVALSAPCHSESRVTFHHNSLMFTERLDAAGALDLTIPAMAKDAVIIAAFDNGEGAVASTQISALPAFHRVVLQWQGDTGLGLHALEFGAKYFSPGHVWADAPGLPNEQNTGYLMSLGNPTLIEARRAEVYSYPSAASAQEGTVTLSVEAEITADNCGRDVAAQTLEMTPQNGIVTQDLMLAVPSCDMTGEFLVLKNLVQDLKIAKN